MFPETLLRGVAGIAATPLPARPRLASWLTVVPLGDGRLQLRAADFSLSITEPLLVAAFLHVQGMLDGTRPLAEVVQSGAPHLLPGTLTFLLQTLRQRGALQEGEPPPGLDAAVRERFDPALRLYAHHVADAEQVLARLQKSGVTLVGDAELCGPIERSLLAAGIGRVTVLAGGAQVGAGAEVAADDLLIAAQLTPGTRFFSTLNQLCLERDVRWLHAALHGRTAILGPLVVPRQTACFTCYVSRRATHDEPVGWQAYQKVVREQGERQEGLLQPLAATLSAQVALEAARVLSGFAPPTCFGRLWVHHASSPRVTGHDVLRVPRCPSCAKKHGPRDPWDTRARRLDEGT